MWIEDLIEGRIVKMLWMSWEEIRDNLEESSAELKGYCKDDQTFVFENKEEFTRLLHNAVDKAIQESHVEDIGELKR